MGLVSMHKKIAKEFTTPRPRPRPRPSDKKIIPLLLLGIILLRITPDDLVISIIQSPVFTGLVALNLFAFRMATYGNKPEYALYCYGMATLLIPYFFYILFNSPDVRGGVANRFKEGGRSALAFSAIGCFAFIIFVFYLGEFNSLGAISKIYYFVFYSKSGIAIFSVGFSFFLVVMFVYFLLYTIGFYKNGDES
jgi:hypothetical protein